jgi:hypothetical protein
LGRIEKSVEIDAAPKKVWEMLALDRFQECTVGPASRILDTKNMEFTSEVHPPFSRWNDYEENRHASRFLKPA